MKLVSVSQKIEETDAEKITFMLKKIILFTILLIAISYTPASAHVLERDGTIGALMHIDPNDDPVAQSPASFFFSFKDTSGKFQPQNCDCRINILEQGKVIYAQPAFENSNGLDATITYTLPSPDVYEIQIKGIPTKGNTFQPFTLTYIVRAEQPENTSQNTSTNFVMAHLGHLTVGLLILLVVIIVAIWNYIDHKSIFPKKTTSSS